MNTAGKWIEIKIAANPLVLEELSPLFFKMGCQGIDEHAQNFILYFENEQWDDTKKLELSAILEKKKITADTISYDSLKEENWNEKWKENFKRFRLGKNIIVKPDWDKYKAKGAEKVVTIIPKMAFGTGQHETTQLILKQLENIVKPGMSVLDAGTGTAILAIYTALMEAHRILAFDNDPLAVENAEENVLLNNVADKIDLKCAILQEIDRRPYDLIIANINRNVLLGMASSLGNYARQGTILLLSGLLLEDREVVLEIYNKEGWLFDRSAERGEWLSLKFMRA